MTITITMVVAYVIGAVIITLITAFARYRDLKVYRSGYVDDWGAFEQLWVPVMILAWPIAIPALLALGAIVLTCEGISWICSRIAKLHLKIGELLNRLFPKKPKVIDEPEDLCESEIVLESPET